MRSLFAKVNALKGALDWVLLNKICEDFIGVDSQKKMLYHNTAKHFKRVWECIRLISDTMFTQNRRIYPVLRFSFEWIYLQKCLEVFNFGPQL